MNTLRGILYTAQFVFEPGEITIDGDRINSVKKCDMAELTDEEAQRYILPGLVDIHLHGCAGYDFCDGTKEALEAMEKYETSCGVTSYCAATMTLPSGRLEKICENAARNKTAGLRGIYLEGPFISKKKKGSQKEAFIRKPDYGLIERLKERSGGLLKFVAIAPEEPGALECIKKTDGVRFSIAHTCADYETVIRAIDEGATHITHLYNAMPPFLHREPGVIGAAADREETEVELICDGVHVHPAVVRSTFKLFGDNRVILVSDSMMAVGMGDGVYTLGAQEVFVNGKRALLSDGTIAGSVSSLYECMINAVSMGIPKEAAIRAATFNPAKAIGVVSEFGTLQSKKAADILITDDNLKLLRVIKSGRVV